MFLVPVNMPLFGISPIEKEFHLFLANILLFYFWFLLFWLSSLSPVKKYSSILSNILHFTFGLCCFGLVSVKFVHFEISHCNKYVIFVLVLMKQLLGGLKSNSVHIAQTNSKVTKDNKDLK